MTNTVSKKKKEFTLFNYLSLLGKNFGKLLLTNLLFALPLIISVGITVLIAWLTKHNDVFILALPILFVSPFFSGVTQVTKDIAKGDKVDVFSSYKKGVKNNFKYFLVHGVFTYLSILAAYFSVTVYWFAAAENNVLYIMLALSLVITLALLFASYLLPIITVTIDIPLKNIYKNSFLMALGELPYHLLVTVVLAVLIATVISVSLLMPNIVAAIIVLAVLGIFVLPSLVSFAINGVLYSRIKKLFIEDDKPEVYKSERVDYQTTAEDIEDIIKKDNKGKHGDYIFYNGKMVKRSEIGNTRIEIDEND